jgi:dynein heavy chain
VEVGGVFEVNFNPDLTTIIRETKYLDQLGFKVPETALSVMLQVTTYKVEI